MPHKSTLADGGCRINALWPRGHAAWEPFYKEGMPHPRAYRRRQSAVWADAGRARARRSETHRVSMLRDLILAFSDHRPKIEDNFSSRL